jgi:hypothetical protein
VKGLGGSTVAERGGVEISRGPASSRIALCELMTAIFPRTCKNDATKIWSVSSFVKGKANAAKVRRPRPRSDEAVRNSVVSLLAEAVD